MEYMKNHYKKIQKNYDPVKQHFTHNIKCIPGPFGPHIAKIICTDCKDSFVKWANKQEYKLLTNNQ